MLSDGNDIGAGHFGDSDTSVGLVGGVEVDVVGTDTRGYGDFELFGFRESFGCQVAWVEAVKERRLAGVQSKGRVCVHAVSSARRLGLDSRCGDDNLSVHQLLVEIRILALLVGSGDQGVALILEPFPDAQLVLGRAQHLWVVSRVLISLSSLWVSKSFQARRLRSIRVQLTSYRTSKTLDYYL